MRKEIASILLVLGREFGMGFIREVWAYFRASFVLITRAPYHLFARNVHAEAIYLQIALRLSIGSCDNKNSLF